MNGDSQSWKFTNLVLSGGGYNTFAILGALDILHDEGALDHLECLAGASAGAILSVLIALGITPREICDLEDLLMGSCVKFNDVRSFVLSGCPLTSNPIRVGLKKVMEGYPGIETLADLRDTMGKNVTIVATRILSGKPEYFDADSPVQYPLVDLLVASASLPMLFEPAHLGGNSYWDGGLFDNLPFQIYPPESTLVVNLSYDWSVEVSPLTRLARFVGEASTRHKLESLTDYNVISVTKPESASSIVSCNTSDKLKMFLSGQAQMRAL